MFVFPSVAASLPPSAGCLPGEGGVPDSVVGELLCGRWAANAPNTVWAWLTGHWPLAATVLALLLGVRLGWAVTRQWVWRRRAAAASWLEIIPPVTATPTATVGLWRLLATLLPAPSRFTLTPARLVWEVRSGRAGMRCGLWIPPGINPSAVVRVVQRAWPGARTTHRNPPQLAAEMPAVALTLVSGRPEWQPIVDDDSTQTRWRPGAPAAEEDDRLRAVYDGLAAAGRTGGGLLQVVVGRAPRPRVAALRRATVTPKRARRPGGASRAAGLLADGLRTLIIGVLDLATPGPSTRVTRPRQLHDPYLSELARQARVKYATAPHLLVAVRAFACGPTRAAARAAAADITSGYGLLSGHFGRRRLRRPRAAAESRWVSEARMMLATVVEAAALAGLPAEPAAYGLPAAASRRRAPSRDVFDAGPVPGSGPAAVLPPRRVSRPRLAGTGPDQSWDLP